MAELETPAATDEGPSLPPRTPRPTIPTDINIVHVGGPGAPTPTSEPTDTGSGPDVNFPREPAGPLAPSPAPGQETSLYREAVNILGMDQDTSRSSRAIGELEKAARDRQDLIARQVAGRRGETEEMGRYSGLLATERAAARPTPLQLPKAPDVQPRAFGDPGPNASFLAQLHSVLLGAGQIFQQMQGLRGPHEAAVAALKGAFEGWQAGDSERANMALKVWEKEQKRLIDEHESRVQAYRDIVADTKTRWDEKIALMDLQAKTDQWEGMGAAAKVSDWNMITGAYQEAEKLGSQQKIAWANAVISLEHYRAQLAETQRAHAETERHNRQTEAAADLRLKNDEKRLDEQLKRDEERLNLARRNSDRGDKLLELKTPLLQMPAQAMKLASAEQSLTNRLRQLDDFESAIKLLDKEGIIPKGPTWAEQKLAQAKLNSSIGRGDIDAALQTVKRQGTALVVGAEMSLGQTASVMRLKAIAEAEAGGITQTTKSYWDQFLPILRRSFNDQLEMTRRHLSVFKGAAEAAKPAMGMGEYEDVVRDLGGVER